MTRTDALTLTGQALYGERWQTALAADLGTSDRTVRRWVAGQTAIPSGVMSDLRGLLIARVVEIATALDKIGLV